LAANGLSTMLQRYFMGHKQDSQKDYDYIHFDKVDMSSEAKKTISFFDKYFI
jgi:hypothetical protein